MENLEDTPEQIEALRKDIVEFYPDWARTTYAPATLHFFRGMLKSNPASRYWALQIVKA